MKNGLFETNILRGFVLTTSMGGRTVIGRYMTVWILQNGILQQRSASSRKKATGCRANFPPADVPPADVPPEVVQNATSDMTLSNMDNDENPEKCEHEEWINRKLHSPWICTNHQHGWENSDMQIQDIMDISEWYYVTRDCQIARKR